MSVTIYSTTVASNAYGVLSGGIFVRGSDGAFVPPDPRNTDYQAYLAWVALGNTATSIS